MDTSTASLRRSSLRESSALCRACSLPNSGVCGNGSPPNAGVFGLGAALNTGVLRVRAVAAGETHSRGSDKLGGRTVSGKGRAAGVGSRGAELPSADNEGAAVRPDSIVEGFCQVGWKRQNSSPTLRRGMEACPTAKSRQTARQRLFLGRRAKEREETKHQPERSTVRRAAPADENVPANGDEHAQHQQRGSTEVGGSLNRGS
uniref:Uncharacterized protein n=1 Tax=Toxoplasma gondii COUG TaxID=1074873 RepID=A0A2G8Y1U5_TOXGO|nr:hypothetical protein TGCOUG_270970 [Toxoplasma gondii COUG]